MEISRRKLLQATAVAGATTALAGSTVTQGRVPTAKATPRTKVTGPATGEGFSVGLGISSMTGAVAGQGMMGYSEEEQVARGLRTPYYARAYIFVDNKTKQRLVYVNVDMACFFESIHREVIKHCAKKYGKLYPESHICITATHNHNSCGGTSHNLAYNMATSGFMENSFKAEVAGICEAIDMAHRGIKPARLLLGRSELYTAGANRSLVSFRNNPKKDQAYFPQAMDPQVRVLRIQHGSKDVGAITWYATHGTSMTDANFYISPDNKGLASYMWEHDEKGVRYLRGHKDFIAAFSQTNAGDISPNIGIVQRKPTGPAGTDFVRNNEIIAERQFKACKEAFDNAEPVSGLRLDVRYAYFDISNQKVDPPYTADGKTWYTTPAIMGGSGTACSEEDNVRCPTWGIPFVKEGWKTATLEGVLKSLGITKMPDIPRKHLLAQEPKVPLLPLGYLPPVPWNPQVVPAQIVRFCDQLTLACSSSEFTIVAGLRTRRVVSKILGYDLEDVILQGYTNSYNQYVTTPEEYVMCQYEGGETQYGRETLGAWLQMFAKLARDMRDKKATPAGPAPDDYAWFTPTWLPEVPADTAPKGKKFGDVLTPPKRGYRRGDKAEVAFVGAHPNNRLRRNNTYSAVERKVGGKWVRVYDDSDYETMFHWERVGKTESKTVVIWNIPKNQPTGMYRMLQFGESKDANGKVTSYKGVSPAFRVN